MHMISHGHDENKGSKTYAVQQEEKIGASTCADCRIHGCWEEKPQKASRELPGRKKELLEYSLKEYQKSENHRFFVTYSEIEKMGYGQWTRIRETIEFCKRMNYKKIGIAFCKGLREEAKGAGENIRDMVFMLWRLCVNREVLTKPRLELRRIDEASSRRI